MSKIKNYLHDLLLIVAVTVVGAGVLSLIAIVITLAIKGRDPVSLMESARGILFLAGSLGLFLSSLFLIRRQKEMRLKFEHQWQAKFKVLRPLPVLLLASAGLLSSGALWDLVLFYR
ncbi:hypothetical protein [Gorillibacterium timonense]|uniref:hypothetical protein n=1 Tax=Gorillibacterium timonense TaxID=1689269 RepID=UPI00071C8454|nr:hypothetical protein [Gorillibacterium timonense]